MSMQMNTLLKTKWMMKYEFVPIASMESKMLEIQ